MFTDVGFHLKSGFKKLLCSQMLVFTLILVSQKYCVHQFSSICGERLRYFSHSLTMLCDFFVERLHGFFLGCMIFDGERLCDFLEVA